jgi:tape measure domain-containing protein
MSAVEEAIVLTKIEGVRNVVAGAQAERDALFGVAESTTAIGIAAEKTRRRSFLMNQALFTMRRFLYLTTFATVGLAAATVKWGYDYNSQMQQGRIALGKFMGSSRAAKRELDTLFQFTAYTPFQFKDVVTSASMLMRFNINASMTNRILRNVTDALAGTSKATPGGLNRIATALGHMMSMGHATGQVLLQLARDGIPGVYDAVKKYFGLNDTQMHHIGTLGLPSIEVLKAINQYIEKSPLHGLARREALGSLHGLLTTSRDFISRIMGTAEQPGYSWTQRHIMALNERLQKAGTAIQQGKPVMPALFGTHPGAFGTDVEMAIRMLKNLWTILTQSVIPAFRVWLSIFQPLKLLLIIVGGVIGMLAKHTTALKYALILMFFFMTPKWVLLFWSNLAIRMALIRGEIMAFRVAAYSLFLYLKSAFGAGVRGAVMLYEIWILRAEYATLLMTKATEAWAAVTYALQFRLLVAQEMLQGIWFWIQFRYLLALEALPGVMETVAIASMYMWDALMGPVGWAIAIITTFGILYWRVKAFHDAVNSVWHFLSTHPMSISFLPVVGQLIQVAGLFQDILGTLTRIYHLINVVAHPIRSIHGAGGGGGLLHRAGGILRGLIPIPLPTHLPHIPHLASGGTVVGGGWSWVGERGPEMRWMPRGAVVAPAQIQPNAFPWGSGQFKDSYNRPIQVQLVADGKVLAEVVAAHKDDVRAGM